MTAIVPVWNRRDLVEPLFATLRAQTLPPEEIIVVDNGSTDGAADEAERRGARLIRLGGNRGFAAAVNRGIAEARSGVVAVINNDVELAPDYLEFLGRAIRQPDVWFATGKILNARERGRIDGTFDLVARSACAWRAGHGRPDDPAFSRPRRIASAPATAAVYRRELFDRIGFFDEMFESYLEDVDLGLRCAAAGLGGFYEPQAVAYHEASGTLGAWHAATIRRISRNQVLLARRHFGLTWAVVAGQVLWGAVALRHGRFGAWLRGKFEGLRAENAPLASRFAGDDREIQTIQTAIGWDPYWRLYFALT
jgi:GT2 family glycosyltransferase